MPGEEGKESVLRRVFTILNSAKKAEIFLSPTELMHQDNYMRAQEIQKLGG